MDQSVSPQSAPRIERLPQVIARTGLCRSSIYAALANPDADFPRPVKLSARSIGFRSDDIDAWIASRRSAR
jgi:prophage regulatory protein